MRTGILGGTFDPVHIGHLVSGDQVGSLLGLDQVVFVPCANPPHKSGTMEAAHHRYRMIAEAIDANEKFSVSGIELERSGYSYSVDTIAVLKNAQPDWNPLYFIMGIDAFLDIEIWKEYEKFLKSVILVVTSRAGYSIEDLKIRLSTGTLELLQPVPEKFLSVQEPGTLDILKLHHAPGTRLYLEIPAIEVSASDIRNRLKKKLSVRYLIPDSVKKYIDKHELYR